MPTDSKTRNSGGAADRLQKMYGEEIAFGNAGEKAWKEKAEAETAVEAATQRFREAVTALAERGLDSDRIAALTAAPVEAVRSARSAAKGRRKGTPRSAEKLGLVDDGTEDTESWTRGTDESAALDETHAFVEVPASVEGHDEQVPV